MKHVSLGELALKLGVNKSKLAYYFSVGLIKPVSKVGKMNVFDEVQTIIVIKKIAEQKKAGKTLKNIKDKK